MTTATGLALRHYAEAPVTLDRTRVYEQSKGGSVYAKPHGFWVSVLGDDDWPSWCEAEEFRLNRLAVPHIVTLAPNARILTLTDMQELSAFGGQYGRETAYNETAIMWDRVAAEYDGITIAPYQWEGRWEVPWYFGWDCASGCIWNLDAIDTVAPAVNP